MTGTTMQLSALTLNINGFVALIKRHRIANQVKKQHLTIYNSQKTHIIEKINTGQESNGGKKFS
jgi:hypothetical protein